MCCNLLSCLTCCGLLSTHKKCCCFIPLRCGVIIFGIFFIVVDGIVLIAYAERMHYFQNIKNEANSRLRQAKEKLEVIANPQSYKAVERELANAVHKVEGGVKKAVDTVTSLPPIKREKRLNLFRWKNNERMLRIRDLFGSDEVPDELSSSWITRRRVLDPQMSVAMRTTQTPGRRLVKASSLEDAGVFWSEQTLRDENKDLPGSKTFKTLFALEIENIVFAVIWWCMAWYLLICGACNMKCCACLWLVAMIARCAEIVIHVALIVYSCWWLKHCGKLVFPNILSIITFVVIPYAIIIVISWIVSK